MSSLVETLVTLGSRAHGLAELREGALDAIAEAVPFDVAFLHAGSPRVPLATAAVRGVDLATLASSMQHWDRWAVELERFRTIATARRGVSTDRDVFPRGLGPRSAFDLAFGRPRVRAVAMVHLLVRDQIVGLLALGRRRDRPFTRADVGVLEDAMPALAQIDALHQRLDQAARAEIPARLACLDQRLTPRQREIVEHVALGHTNAQIGRALAVSANTVRNLLARVTARLGASNRADVVRLAVLRPA